MLEKLTKILLEKKLIISTAESCTGGLLSSLLTDISGSSAFIKINFVTYSNEAKAEILNVSSDILNNYGAVSEECARAMAEGLYNRTNCDIALSTTGIAGPTGGSYEKPVGLCYISCHYKNKTFVKKILENPDTVRHQMKLKFAQEAIKFAYEILNNQ